jgi:hypothetical protein
MEDVQASKAPVHLWIVGILGLLWNAIGCYDYFMTRTRNTDYFTSMMPNVDPAAALAWVDSFPMFAQFGWGLGVWGGLLGSVLLLMRSKWATIVLGLSMLGAIISLGYQVLAAAPPPPGMMDEGPAALMPYVIIAIAIGLFLYARAQQQKGVLR